MKVTLPDGNVRVRSLVSREDFVMNGGLLTVTEPSEIQARFEIGNGSILTADGRDALFIASGATIIDGGAFTAKNGGNISLPLATSYTNTAGNVTWSVTGAGSVLSLPNLTSVTNVSSAQRAFNIEALSGGVIDLSGVTQFVDPNSGGTTGRAWNITSDGVGSRIDVSSLVSLQDLTSADNDPTGNAFFEGRSTLVITNRATVVTSLLFPTVENFTVTINSGGELRGSLEGSGSADLRGNDGSVIGDLSNRGTVRPGTSPGALTISGDYTQTSAGTLSIELGGAGAGVGYDQLRVGGTATLDGTLELSLINSFDPAVGTVFDVITYGSRSGVFAVINGQNLGGGKQLAESFDPAKLVLTTTAALQDSASAAPAAVDSLNQADLETVVDAAIQRFVAATGSTAIRDVLSNVEFRIADLSGNFVGHASSSIVWIDQDAAGFGWFIDSTPFDDEEFDGDGHATAEIASGRVDLLSVVMHEFGHVLGLEHHDDDHDGLMAPTIDLGERLEILPELVDELLAHGDWPW